MLPDRCEKLVEIGDPIGLNAHHVKAWPRHLDVEQHSLLIKHSRRDRLPCPSVLGDHQSVHFASHRCSSTVVNVVDILELERELRAHFAVKLKVNVPGSAIGRRSFVVVIQIDDDRAAPDNLVPEGRGILEVSVDVLEPHRREWRTIDARRDVLCRNREGQASMQHCRQKASEPQPRHVGSPHVVELENDQ